LRCSMKKISFTSFVIIAPWSHSPHISVAWKSWFP
jgi:hypothetical protein